MWTGWSSRCESKWSPGPYCRVPGRWSQVTVCQELGTNSKYCRFRMNCGSDMLYQCVTVDQIKFRIQCKGETRRQQLRFRWGRET